MKFKNIAELVSYANSENKPISEIMIEAEMDFSERSREEVYTQMEDSLVVMERAVLRGLTEDVKSHSGMTGGDAKKIDEYRKINQPLAGDLLLEAVSKAVSTSEVNAAMGTIVATPTAGSCGVLPGVLFSVGPRLGASHDQMVRALFHAGAVGFVIANNAMISGATGGCQAEVGSAVAMAAAAIVEMRGGTPQQSAEAISIALKNMLGLVCDPIAGLVEAPCVKRNAMGAAYAIVSADLALAGVTSIIPTDEVIEAMYRVGLAMPSTLRETALGGLATTPTGKSLENKIFGKVMK
ncbi:MAG: L-serine ammonia-lyase, iron-sulfur-dependent, subunit alpha [Bacilli bacterium]